MTQFMAFRLPHGPLPSPLVEHASPLERFDEGAFETLRRQGERGVGQWWVLRAPGMEWADVWCQQAAQRLREDGELLGDTHLGSALQTMRGQVQEIVFWYARQMETYEECLDDWSEFLEFVQRQLLDEPPEVWARWRGCTWQIQ